MCIFKHFMKVVHYKCYYYYYENHSFQLLKHMGHLSEKLPGCTGLPPQKGPQNTNVGTVISVILVWKICIA